MVNERPYIVSVYCQQCSLAAGSASLLLVRLTLHQFSIRPSNTFLAFLYLTTMKRDLSYKLFEQDSFTHFIFFIQKSNAVFTNLSLFKEHKPLFWLR